MAYSGPTGSRPTSLNGCWASFAMTHKPSTVRSETDDGSTIKVRRRTTAPIRTAEADVTIAASLYDAFKQWFANTMEGSLPTLIQVPLEGEQLWRFSEPPTYNFIQGANGPAAVLVTVKLEQLPEWR